MFVRKALPCIKFFLQKNRPRRIIALRGHSLSKNYCLPAKRAIQNHFLPQLCRGKKYIYPHKCAVWRLCRQTVRAARMFSVGKVFRLFRQSETAQDHSPARSCSILCRGSGKFLGNGVGNVSRQLGSYVQTKKQCFERGYMLSLPL